MTARRSSGRQATAAEVEELARELAKDFGISLDAARELARRGLTELREWAEEWDRRPGRPVWDWPAA